MLYDFLAISIWTVFVKWIIVSVVKSISFGSKIHGTLCLYVLLITSCGVQAEAGGQLLKRVFRCYLSKFLSSWGTISSVYIRSEPSSFYLFVLGPLLKWGDVFTLGHRKWDVFIQSSNFNCCTAPGKNLCIVSPSLWSRSAPLGSTDVFQGFGDKVLTLQICL